MDDGRSSPELTLAGGRAALGIEQDPHRAGAAAWDRTVAEHVLGAAGSSTSGRRRRRAGGRGRRRRFRAAAQGARALEARPGTGRRNCGASGSSSAKTARRRRLAPHGRPMHLIGSSPTGFRVPGCRHPPRAMDRPMPLKGSLTASSRSPPRAAASRPGGHAGRRCQPRPLLLRRSAGILMRLEVHPTANQTLRQREPRPPPAPSAPAWLSCAATSCTWQPSATRMPTCSPGEAVDAPGRRARRGLPATGDVHVDVWRGESPSATCPGGWQRHPHGGYGELRARW